jgi:L-amino acid N-acyltransferase YncA
MNGTKLIERLRRFFSTGPAAHSESEAAAVVEQSLKDTSELFNTQLNKTKALRTELQYIYHIFLRRNKCSYKLEFSAGPHFLLFTTERDASGINILVYIPRESVEIAEVYAHPHDGELAIDSMKLDFPFCDRRFGELLLQELIAEARAKSLHRIRSRLSKPADADFDRTARFCREAGFEVTLTDDGEAWEIQYNVEL